STAFKTRVPEYKGPDVGKLSAASREYHRLRNMLGITVGTQGWRERWISRKGAEGSRRDSFSTEVRHSEAEDAEARSLRFALREWGSYGLLVEGVTLGADSSMSVALLAVADILYQRFDGSSMVGCGGVI
ncbi:MAG: hypothetical protein K2L11_11640, partial [Muribaculaceae bacterium]|nr:hypothetical protein [Muribaculaceae bacterium]